MKGWKIGQLQARQTGKEMMYHRWNEHGPPARARSYLGFLLITATPDICISLERSSFVCACRLRRRVAATMRDRETRINPTGEKRKKKKKKKKEKLSLIF